MDQLNTIQLVAVWAIPILFAVTLHEAAHGYVAYRLGDDTAYRLGRITANPIKHIDPIGTIIVPVLLLLTTKFVFGWAKPVPVDRARLRNPKRDFLLVSLAGPTSNFLMAVAWMILLKLAIFLLQHHYQAGLPLLYMSQAGVIVNLVLAVLNIIPIPPLDGSRLLTYLLPAPWDARVEKAAPIGMILVLILAVSGLLGPFLIVPVNYLQKMLMMIFGIH